MVCQVGEEFEDWTSSESRLEIVGEETEKYDAVKLPLSKAINLWSALQKLVNTAVNFPAVF